MALNRRQPRPPSRPTGRRRSAPADPSVIATCSRTGAICGHGQVRRLVDARRLVAVPRQSVAHGLRTRSTNWIPGDPRPYVRQNPCRSCCHRSSSPPARAGTGPPERPARPLRSLSKRSVRLVHTEHSRRRTGGLVPLVEPDSRRSPDAGCLLHVQQQPPAFPSPGSTRPTTCPGRYLRAGRHRLRPRDLRGGAIPGWRSSVVPSTDRA